MIKLPLHILFLTLLSITSFGQNAYFHKVFKLPNKAVTRPFNIKYIDSTYYITGHVSDGFGVNVLFMTMDSQGDFKDTSYLIDTVNLNPAAYSFTKLDTNVNGNFMLHYRSTAIIGNTINKHERLELDRSGQVLFKNSLDTFINTDMDCRDYGELILDNNNGVYYTADHFITDTAGYGIAITKFSQVTHDLIWMKKIYSTGVTTGVDKSKRTLLMCNNGDVMLVYTAIKGNYFSALSQQFGKTYFVRYNSDGVQLQQNVVDNDIITYSGFGAKLVNNDKELVICLTQSQVLQTTSGWSYYGMIPSIAKLDSNFQVVWQHSLGGQFYDIDNLYFHRFVNDFVVQSDTAIVGASFYLELGGGPDTTKSTYVRLENRDVNSGMLNWQRKIQYFSTLTPNQHPTYEIGDIESTPDGGFILVGQVTNYDSIQAGQVGRFGYLLKTNCLGFLADPQAGFSATTKTDSMAVNFQNTSLMGGSFQWSFGDGTIFNTGENVGFDTTQPSVSHTYLDSGAYDVQLIAYGCNGANDTITQTIVVSKSAPVEVPNPNIINYMAVGPNPVKSGESIAVYVGNLPSTSAVLSFYDYQGKLVMERVIGQENSTYIIVLPFSSGVYQAVLKNRKEVLEVEKILIY
jgi:PKD repeat protein